MARPTITDFAIQTGTDRTFYAIWRWSLTSKTENYRVIWYYGSGDDHWFVGTDSTVDTNQSLYTPPDNARSIRFKVRPIPKKTKRNGVETPEFTAQWSTEKYYNFKDLPPAKPDTPDVELEGNVLRATIDGYNPGTYEGDATYIEFQVAKISLVVNDDGSTREQTQIFKERSTTSVTATGYMTYTKKVASGAKYRVRCRGARGKKKPIYSEYSDWSEIVKTRPEVPPGGITECRADSESSVYLKWGVSTTADSYEIEYSTEKKYLDRNSNSTTTVSGIKQNQYYLTGLESGDEYFFRVRAVNDSSEASAWSSIVSTIIGAVPSAPTTWSSTTTATTGDEITLYWTHNSEDGSVCYKSYIELIINGEVQIEERDYEEIEGDNFSDEDHVTRRWILRGVNYSEDTEIKWRVRTAGVTRQYGDWSVQRTVNFFEAPTIDLEVIDSDGEKIEELQSFPFYVKALTYPNTQTPIGYHVSIIANRSYETEDEIGNLKIVSKGDELYSKFFDISTPLTVEFSANNIDLENNESYEVRCVATMDSGLIAETKEQEVLFDVAWKEEEYSPNAQIVFNENDCMASIIPYCEDDNENLIDGIVLSVYRREFDGSFTEIAKNISNNKLPIAPDPHPALDYLRYRIIATHLDTGAISYTDTIDPSIKEPAVIIQWDEQWTMFETNSEDELEEPPWTGSLLRLPYNVDVSDSYGVDVSLVEYIGRKRPVSYYGTQLGESSSWSVEIDKADKETLYGLRRLAIWTGDVYVREPSGSGYWANVNVSFGQKHTEVTIPVTLDIVRVEGGM